MASFVLIRFFLLAAVATLCLFSHSADGYFTCNPTSYAGNVYADHSGNYRGQCVSFVKVILYNTNQR